MVRISLYPMVPTIGGMTGINASMIFDHDTYHRYVTPFVLVGCCWLSCAQTKPELSVATTMSWESATLKLGGFLKFGISKMDGLLLKRTKLG